MEEKGGLVKYDSPIVVGANGRGWKKAKKSTNPTEDILNSILPPREWTHGGHLWLQYVSSNPATRNDVGQLAEQLDKRLTTERARMTGICPIREQLFSECFDELIRQVTVGCAERGLLLLRIRDELRMTVASYQALYESSVAYGMRKALKTQHKKAQLTEHCATLESECTDLERQIRNLRDEIDNIDEMEAAKRKQALEKHEAEINALTEQNERLTLELEQQLALPKKSAAAET